MKEIKVYNAVKVIKLKAGRKGNRKSILVVPAGMSGRELREWKDKHLSRR
jgi:hypothetical protein